MKIIIIDHEPFSERKKEHYFIESFINRGVYTEYWAVNEALDYTKYTVYNYKDSAEYVTYFSNVKSIIDRLKILDTTSTFVFMEIWFNYSTRKIFKTIVEKQLKWGRIDYYLNPTCNLNPSVSIRDKLLFVNRNNFLSILKNRFGRLLYSNDELNIPDLFFVTGSCTELVPKSKKVVSIDYFDILNYNKNKNTESYVKGNYIVFLDIMLVDHPDVRVIGITEDVINRKEYFSKLNTFFNDLENKYNMPVVIASHPKADYQGEFGDRLCVKNRTDNLVINSSLVVTHGSLSISYALLANVPMIYFYLGERVESNFILKDLYGRIEIACNKLGVKSIDIDRKYELDNKVDINSELYKCYLEKYFCRSFYEKYDNFQIVWNNLFALFDEREEII